MQADDPMAAFAQPRPQQQQQLPQQPQPPTAAQQPQQQTAAQPTTAVNNKNSNSNNLPYSLYDVILDIPHPGISTGTSSNSTPTQIFYPPTNNGSSEGIVNTISQQDLLSEFGPPTTTTSPILHIIS